jgi:hypothetical protein
VKRIYVASSWRNPHHVDVIRQLTDTGYDVYDYRNPLRSRRFIWSEADPEWKAWTADRYRQGLKHPRVQECFNSDFGAMKWADVGLLVLPSDRSAHLELGWMAGAGKRTMILTRDGEEPELMNLLADHICASMDEVLWELHQPKEDS